MYSSLEKESIQIINATLVTKMSIINLRLGSLGPYADRIQVLFSFSLN